MNTYRVRVTADRGTHYVDVEAADEMEASKLALEHRDGSAKCVGLTADCEARGAAGPKFGDARS